MIDKPEKSDKRVVVFLLFRKMSYSLRIFISFGLVLAGFVFQYLTMKFFPGIVFPFLGVLLLLVKGYDNKVKFTAFDPSAAWEKVQPGTLKEIMLLNKKMKRWARSATNINSGLGVLFFILLVSGILALMLFAVDRQSRALLMLACNAAVLTLPFWFSGTKRILTTPGLVIKIKNLLVLTEQRKEQLKDHTVEYYILKQGSRVKVPSDVKIRILFNPPDKDFLGLYGQVSLNSVSGADYPYFYVVLVAKIGFGLPAFFETLELPDGLVKELEEKEDVEVIVIRQYTSKTSGYHTNERAMSYIFDVGIACGLKVTGKTTS
jgi:hypothetical protein